MREIFLNGYIDEEIWFGDEITPGMLNDALYCSGNVPKEDVRIILNSYGGSCNAATQCTMPFTITPARCTWLSRARQLLQQRSLPWRLTGWK